MGTLRLKDLPYGYIEQDPKDRRRRRMDAPRAGLMLALAAPAEVVVV